MYVVRYLIDNYDGTGETNKIITEVETYKAAMRFVEDTKELNKKAYGFYVRSKDVEEGAGDELLLQKKLT